MCRQDDPGPRKSERRIIPSIPGYTYKTTVEKNRSTHTYNCLKEGVSIEDAVEIRKRQRAGDRYHRDRR